MENGVACAPDNRYLLALIEAVRRASGAEPAIGRKPARDQRTFRAARAGGGVGSERSWPARQGRTPLHSQHRALLPVLERPGSVVNRRMAGSKRLSSVFIDVRV